MQLKIKRSQEKAGLVAKNIVFVLEARAQYTEQERFAIGEYGLGKEIIYSSEKAKKHTETAQSGGLLRAATGAAMAALSLSISVDSLGNGQVIKCKSLEEVLAAEEALREACQNVNQYISVASAFNGSEEIIEF